MGKLKVEEIAKKLNTDVSVVIKKLKSMGEKDVNKDSFVDEANVSKLLGTNKTEASVNPHIIRRKVKVVTTDKEGNQVERITTNSGGTVQKTSVVHEANNNKPSYSKEGLGVVKSNYSRNNRNNMQNIVVTQNGKKVEPKQEMVEAEVVEVKEEIKEVVKEPVTTNEPTQNVAPRPAERTYDNRRENNYQNRDNSGYRNNNNNNGNSGYNNGPRPNYQNRDNTGYRSNNGTGGYNNNGSRPDYQNRDNSGYRNNNNGPRPNYQNRDNTGYRNNNGTGGYNNNGPRPNYQNRDNTGYRSNNGTGGYNNNGPRPNYQNRDNSGYRNNSGTGGYNNNGSRPGFQNRDNTGYKVNKFIKESQLTETVQKETRDYSTALIDKKKLNEEKVSVDTKRDKKNVNEIREQNTRIDFNKFRGMQVSEEGLIDLYDRGESRKYGAKRKKQRVELNTTKIIPLTEIKLPEVMTVKTFAELMKKQSSEIIKKLFSLGIMATVNQEIDFDTAYLIANEFGINAEKEVIVTEEDILFDDEQDDEQDLEVRPPIVTIMGHVDHGKTSLLDKIRETNVVGGESGGITQHIGAYKVAINGREITFLDTPGHAAFTEMRARGAQITDIVIIVVAADDGIKPQTREAIDHAKAAGVPIIVAINKIDKEGANIEKVKQELLEVELVPEEWGGETICVPVSAKSGQGIENLLEMILLVADVKELRANPNKQAKGTVVEAKLDKTKGALATVLVQRGTLNVGDTVVLGNIVGKVRSMTNDKGEKVKKAGPSTPVEILGLGTVPETGDIFYEVKDEKTANKLIEKRKAQVRLDLIKQGASVTLSDLFDKIQDGKINNLDVVLRADVQGSAQALKDSLEKLSNDEVRVRVIASNTGVVTESDVTLAKVSNAIIIGFNTKVDNNAQAIADKEKIEIKLYKVIYDAINDVEAAMKGMLKPTYKEVDCGVAEVRNVFKVTNAGTIAGCYIKSGKVLRNSMCRLIRAGEVICTAKLDSLKREKDDQKEVAEGYECGIKLEKWTDIKEGDIIECYEIIEEKR